MKRHKEQSWIKVWDCSLKNSAKSSSDNSQLFWYCISSTAITLRGLFTYMQPNPAQTWLVKVTGRQLAILKKKKTEKKSCSLPTDSVHMQKDTEVRHSSYDVDKLYHGAITGIKAIALDVTSSYKPTKTLGNGGRFSKMCVFHSSSGKTRRFGGHQCLISG